MTAFERLARRVRHDLKPRLLTVRQTGQLTATLHRVVLEGADLEGFVSLGFDDHVKLVLPAPGAARPVLPRPGEGLPAIAGQALRDYTPRRHDAAAGTLAIDFVMHGDGPAASWAAAARPGDALGVLGPRGSFVVPAELDWHLLAGDEAALPAIARRLEELPAGTRAFVAVEVAELAAELPLPSRAQVELRWLHRHGRAPGDAAAQLAAVAGFDLPPGAGYAWAAAEAGVARALRHHLVAVRGLPPAQVKAAAYWTRDRAGSGGVVEAAA
ncbi:siderophore-interacting protein [Marinibaculum pumilum]|uniref:Siderophore-interacting protein n=1 Tax=Marinibaculum pumilum TaxID=1766165 RepID=A0ABV7KTU0_9PROT